MALGDVQGHEHQRREQGAATRGVLEPGGDGKASRLIRLPGLGTQRCYVVKTIPGTDESEARAA